MTMKKDSLKTKAFIQTGDQEGEENVGVPPKTLCTSVSCLEYCLLFNSVFLFKVHVFFGGLTDVFCITVPNPNAKPEYEEMFLLGALCSPREAVVMENENSLDVDSPLVTGSLWANQAQRNVVCTRSQPRRADTQYSCYLQTVIFVFQAPNSILFEEQLFSVLFNYF